MALYDRGMATTPVKPYMATVVSMRFTGVHSTSYKEIITSHSDQLDKYSSYYDKDK